MYLFHTGFDDWKSEKVTCLREFSAQDVKSMNKFNEESGKKILNFFSRTSGLCSSVE